jgi:uncharacterized protein YjbJ (UPF0337 family)
MLLLHRLRRFNLQQSSVAFRRWKPKAENEEPATRSEEREARFIADAPVLEVVALGEAITMNKDEIDGKAEQIKGKMKQAAGDLTDDEQLHDEGVADEAAGNVQEGFGRGRRKVGEAIEDIGEKLKR